MEASQCEITPKYEITEEDGFQAICKVIEYLNLIYKSNRPKSVNSLIRYIFRGVTCEYDGPIIKSGSSVRLSMNYDSKETSMRITQKTPKYSYADYINYNKNLISDARKNFPDVYSKLSDLEVLADIQHKGGATCLVDFSKNVLIALWFACSGDYEKDGVLYCYETIEDIIYRNKLSVLTTKDSTKPIESLLVETRKCANFRGKYSHKFWMWYPSCINDRISNQDSVFIFGLEKFDINEHGIKKIVIKPKAKKDILFVLAQCFNISAVTIYHDVDGYADSNAKFKDLISNNRDGSADAYNNGFDNMLVGNYEIALDFFMQSELMGANIDSKTSIEILYSKAVCYKHLGDIDNAIIKYNQTYKLCNNVVSKGNSDDTEYYYMKSFKACNDELYLLYELSLYDRCLESCKHIIELIGKYNAHPNHFELLDETYCKIAQIELFLLKTLNDNGNNFKENRKTYFKLLEIEGHERDFYHILLLYFKQFGEIYFVNDKLNKNKKMDLCSFIDDIEKELSRIEHNVVFSEWNFCDINKKLQELIDSTKESSQKDYFEKLMKLKFLTSKMVDIQNIVHNNYLKTTSEYSEDDRDKM